MLKIIWQKTGCFSSDAMLSHHNTKRVPFSFLFLATPALRVSNKTGQNNTKIKSPSMHTTSSPGSTRNHKNLAFPLQCFTTGPISWVMHLRVRKALKKITSFECLQRNNSLGSLNNECMNRRWTLKVRTITERGQVIRMNTSEALLQGTIPKKFETRLEG